jgi:hypothetical protein
MKRILGASGLLLLTLLTGTAFAQSTAPPANDRPNDRQPYRERSHRFDNRLLDDVVEMTHAQLPESSILAFLHSRRSRLSYDVHAQDLIRLHRAGVSDRVIDYIAGIAGIDEEGQYNDRHRDRGYEGEGDGYDGSPADPDPGTDIVAEPGPYGGDYGGGGWYGGWGPYWDPWWWGGGVAVYYGGHGHGGHGHGGHGGHHSNNGSHGGNHGGSHGSGSRAYSGGGGSHGGSHGGGSHGGGHGGGGRH